MKIQLEGDLLKMRTITVVVMLFVCVVFTSLFSGCSTERPKASKPASAYNSATKARNLTASVKDVKARPRNIDGKSIDVLIDDIERLITIIQFEPPVKQWSDETLSDLKKYRLRLKNPGFKSDLISLDCVMMIHDTLSSMNEPNMLALESQKNIVSILESTKPEMIGMEGIDVDEVNLKSLAESQVRLAKRGNNTVSIEDAYKGVDQMIPQDGVLMYMKKYPEAKITGTDPASFMVLSLYIGSPEIPIVPAKNPSPKLLSELDENLILLRSYVGVIRTLEAADKKGLKHSSIVIGGSHARDILEYGTQLGISMRFYQAIPEAYIKKEPHLQFP